MYIVQPKKGVTINTGDDGVEERDGWELRCGKDDMMPTRTYPFSYKLFYLSMILGFSLGPSAESKEREAVT